MAECDVIADKTCKVCLPCDVVANKSPTDHQYENNDGFIPWLWGEDVWSLYTLKAYDIDVQNAHSQANATHMREHCVAFVELLRILKTILMCFPCRSSYNAFYDASPPHPTMLFQQYIHTMKQKVNAKLNKPSFPYSLYYQANVKEEAEKAWKIHKVSAKWYYSFFSFLYMVALNFAFSFDWEIPRHIEMMRDVNRLFVFASDLIPSPANEFRHHFQRALQITCVEWSCYLHNAAQQVHLRENILTYSPYALPNAAEASSILQQRTKSTGQQYYFFHRRDVFHFVHDLELNVIRSLTTREQGVESVFGATCTDVQHYFEHCYRAKTRLH
jgi:hypothetical protein